MQLAGRVWKGSNSNTEQCLTLVSYDGNRCCNIHPRRFHANSSRLNVFWLFVACWLSGAYRELSTPTVHSPLPTYVPEFQSYVPITGLLCTVCFWPCLSEVLVPLTAHRIRRRYPSGLVQMRVAAVFCVKSHPGGESSSWLSAATWGSLERSYQHADQDDLTDVSPTVVRVNSRAANLSPTKLLPASKALIPFSCSNVHTVSLSITCGSKSVFRSYSNPIVFHCHCAILAPYSIHIHNNGLPTRHLHHVAGPVLRRPQLRA